MAVTGSTRRLGGRETIAGLSLLAVLTACGVDNTTLDGPAGDVRDAVVVGSGDTTVSELVAEIYAGAVRSTGVSASTRPDLGDRAAYLEQLDAGSVSLVPEFTGDLLGYYEADSHVTAQDDVFEALSMALPEGLSISDFAAAEDRSVLVVTEGTSGLLGVRTVEDLGPLCGESSAVFSPRYARDDTAAQLQSSAGCTFASTRVAADDASVVQELTGGGAVVAGLTTASPDAAGPGLVVLGDEDHVFTAQNVVPLFRDGTLGDAQIKALNIVAGELATADLADMVDQVRERRTSSADAARAWLEAHL